jgi:hypothetical protein
MWDSGVSESNMKEYISTRIRQLNPNYTPIQIIFLTNTLFSIATSGKNVRVFLSEEQIENIPREKGNSGTCGTCLEEYGEEEEMLILPCEGRHAFHEDCIVPWLKMSVFCPSCRKDLREC